MMLKRIVQLCLLPLLLLTGSRAMAQTHNPVMDSLVKQMGYYGAKKSGAVMFVHLDKTVYVNNEMMWFSAYLLNCAAADLFKHEVLSAALINNKDQSIAAEGKYAMAAGMGFGNMVIPDSIPPGNYSFIAYTNRMVNGRPGAYFVQHITLKAVTQPTFNVALTLDTLYKDPANLRVLVQADIRSKPVDGAVIDYYLGKDARTGLSGKAKTNVIGSYTLLVPKTAVTAAQHNLEVDVKYGKEVKTLHLAIPVKKQITDVRFYPEGGHLISNIQNRVGWEVKTAGGTAIKMQGVLYADHKMIDTVETDSYGMGAFYINPASKVIYTVKLLPDAGQVYTLPASLSNGVVMHIANALVNDTLKLQIGSVTTGKYILLIHNYKQLFSSVILHPSPQGLNVKADLSGVPRGLNMITILDSLQRPCAERLFFAHYDQKPRVSISTDVEEAGTRQKVKLKIKLNGLTGKPVNGLVSIACVQDNRFEVKNDNNIEHYAYLQNELDDLPLKDDLLGNSEVDRMYLNELLLVRGWSKYKWPELMQATQTDTVEKDDNMLFTGSIEHLGGRIKKPVQVLLMKDSTRIYPMTSSLTGTFALENRYMYTRQERRIQMIVSGNSNEYIINLKDPYVNVNKTLAKNIEPVLFDESITQNTKAFLLTGFEHATHLREVKIRPDNGALYRHHGDYICRYHVLNCTVHVNERDNRPPQIGEMVYMGPISQGLSPYHTNWNNESKPGMVSFNGIYTAREFYEADYTQLNPTEPDYLSTICWKHSVNISSDKETEISFYTSDITGKYRIVVQGVTNEDVVYGQSSFTVKKKSP